MKPTPLGRAVILAAVLGLGALSGAVGASAARPRAQAWRCVLVRPGDSLWSLAKAVRPGSDPRVVVETIAKHNQLRDPRILPGTALWLPWDGSAWPAESSECGVVP
jgi:hypothetical protein